MPFALAVDSQPLADWIGSLGVTILLAAFLLNVLGRVTAASRRYQLANAVGAALACLASCLIGYIPFVVLEGTWCLVAIVSLLRKTGGSTH